MDRYYGPYMTATPVTYHLSRSALMATQGAGTGVSAGAAVSESDMVLWRWCYPCASVVACAREKKRMES